ncbi:MAG: nucleoside hydrolase, partial [Erysipelotrichaceae bacterium]|nr:nucleoside hydrolase [Erysipelotrichaceae bacterium]
LVYPEDWERIRTLNNPVARIVAEWFDFFFIHVKSLGWKGATTHDPCAVMSIVHPEIFDIRDYYVDIELNGEYTRGATVCDFRGTLNKEPNCRCVVDLDREKFVDYLYQACATFEGWEVDL